MADQEKTVARLAQQYQDRKEFLIYDDGKILRAKDCADAWSQVNQFLLDARTLKLYRVGNRHIVPRIKIVVAKWENLIPLKYFGWPGTKGVNRLKRLQRNYLNLESLLACRNYMDRRNPDHHSTHGITFGTGRKKTPPCMVGGTFHWAPGRLLVDFSFRASEVTKTFGADIHFLNKVIFGDESTGIQAAVPKWMSDNLGSVVLNLNMGFVLAQWFPLFDMIQPGYPLNDYDHRFHKMCLDSVRQARDIHGYQSKWRAERRIHLHYRKHMRKFTTDKQGRILRGPTFFPHPKEHVS